MLRYWRFRIELFSDRCVCMSVTCRPSHQFKFTGIWKYSPSNIIFCLLLSNLHSLGKVLCCKFNLHLCSADLQTSFYVMFNISQNIWFSYAIAYPCIWSFQILGSPRLEYIFFTRFNPPSPCGTSQTCCRAVDIVGGLSEWSVGGHCVSSLVILVLGACGKSPVTSKHLNMVKFYSQDFLSISSAGFGHRFSPALRACFERFHEFLKPVAYRKMEITVGFVFSNGKFSSISALLLFLLLLSIKSQRYCFFSSYIFCRQHLWEMMRFFWNQLKIGLTCTKSSKLLIIPVTSDHLNMQTYKPIDPLLYLNIWIVCLQGIEITKRLV